MTKSNIFTAIIYKEDDMYIAECPEIGTVDQGKTIEQAITGLKEATRLYLKILSYSAITDPVECVTLSFNFYILQELKMISILGLNLVLEKIELKS